MIEHRQMYINGKWIDSGAVDVIPVVNPATEETIATIPRGTAEDVDSAARAAADAFPRWSKSTIEDRVAIFSKLARLVEARSEEITDTIISEVGYPKKLAAISQTAGSVEELDIIAESLPQIAWTEQIGDTVLRREPSGVLGAITAWNAPLRSIISKAGAAIAAGCTVVLKASEVAPLTAYLFAELATEAGLPDGVLNLVSGNGPEVGEPIASHPLIDMVSITGSVRAGRRVMELASQSVKRVHLELGGKSANIILSDADLQRAVATGIEDAFRNTGQVCGGLTRMLVPRDRLAEAEALAASKAESYVIGDPLDPATTLGPVATEDALHRVRGYIKTGSEEGARLLTGGVEAPDGISRGYFVRPTIFTGDNSMRIAQEEIFGPVLVIIPFDNEAEALAIANDSVYGLAGAIWSADVDRARQLATHLRTGRIRINGAPLNKRATHGGFKLSGVGREWGRVGVEEFMEYQSIIG